LTINLEIAYYEMPAKAKAVARRGRKAMGLIKIAWLPGVRQRGFFYVNFGAQMSRQFGHKRGNSSVLNWVKVLPKTVFWLGDKDDA
jgi:hypothetical protein